jgi:hypothetical protein
VVAVLVAAFDLDLHADAAVAVLALHLVLRRHVRAELDITVE